MVGLMLNTWAASNCCTALPTSLGWSHKLNVKLREVTLLSPRRKGKAGPRLINYL
jgi:hypothetical protein